MVQFTVKRLADGPIVHPGLSSSIGTNINGPSVIRVPEWVTDPLGRFYLYFADHRGDHIRLAFADEPAGAWRVHEAGTLWLKDSGFPVRASELAPPERYRASVASGRLRPHIASPDVHVDRRNQRIVMHFHGLERDCTQTTRRAVSVNGIEFRDPRPTVADYYARVFEWRGTTYAMARAGSMHRSVDGGQTFPEKTRLGETNIRHVAVFAHQGELYSVYSRIGDAPERLVISRVSTEGDWRQWRLDDTRELLRAGPEWEGGHLPVEPSAMGPADQPMNQLRDPFVLVDRGQPWLFYACAGESGLGLALMTPDDSAPNSA